MANVSGVRKLRLFPRNCEAKCFTSPRPFVYRKIDPEAAVSIVY